MKIAAVVIVCLFLYSPLASGVESRYVDNHDGTVKDTLSDLIWIKDPDRTPGLTGTMVWITAKRACENLVWADSGPGTWYMPNIKELQGLVEESSSAPRIDTMHFNCAAEPYWSNTNDTGNGTRAWVVHFGTGNLMSYPKLSLMNPAYLRIRCARKA